MYLDNCFHEIFLMFFPHFGEESNSVISTLHSTFHTVHMIFILNFSLQDYYQTAYSKLPIDYITCLLVFITYLTDIFTLLLITYRTNYCYLNLPIIVCRKYQMHNFTWLLHCSVSTSTKGYTKLPCVGKTRVSKVR